MDIEKEIYFILDRVKQNFNSDEIEFVIDLIQHNKADIAAEFLTGYIFEKKIPIDVNLSLRIEKLSEVLNMNFEEEIIFILSQVNEHFTEEEKNNVKEFAENNEPYLALETLCAVLLDKKIAISQNIFDHVKKACDALNLDEACWKDLKVNDPCYKDAKS
jgi:hypothetical protein